MLEYIYTGEVHVPANSLSPFVDAARALHIKGLETVVSFLNNKINIKPDVYCSMHLLLNKFRITSVFVSIITILVTFVLTSIRKLGKTY